MARKETERNTQLMAEKAMKGKYASDHSVHVFRVSDLALSRAHKQGLSSYPDSMEIVGLAAYSHDIGFKEKLAGHANGDLFQEFGIVQDADRLDAIGAIETKAPVMAEVVPVITEITEDKLNGSNYLVWSKTIRIYLRSIDKDDHLTDDPPTDNTRQAWLRDDARLFLQIQNSIDNKVIGSISHCEFVKELMDYLDYLYFGKGNISRIYEVCKSFYRAEQQSKSLSAYFMDFKRTYEELNLLLPFSSDFKVQQAQREKMAVMSFLIGLPPEFEAIKSHILSESDISSLQEIFSRVLRTEHLQTPQSITNKSSLVSCGGPRGGNNCDKNAYGRSQVPRDIVCYYCHESGHTKRACKKLQNKHQRS